MCPMPSPEMVLCEHFSKQALLSYLCSVGRKWEDFKIMGGILLIIVVTSRYRLHW